jgi:uncharacterized membrane protein
MRKALEAAGIGALVVLIWMTYRGLAGPDRLPDKIPTHFDLAGHPNAWGSTVSLLFLPILAVVLYLAITVVARFPSAFNYPVRVTLRNRDALQQLALSMLAWLKAELACLFAWIQSATIDAARHDRFGLTPSLLPITPVVVFGTIVWHFVAMRRTGSMS